MQPGEYERMDEADERSWWFRARRRILQRVIAGMALPAGARIVDVGCGTGGNLRMLAGYGEATGVEPSPVGAELARRRTGLPIVEASSYDTGLASSSVALVCMSDVLEHLDDDRRALHEVHRILAPGGRFLLTVPAFPFLWSGHDVALEHRRRYRRGPLSRLLGECGLRVDWLTYYNALLFFPVAGVRVARRLLRWDTETADGTGVLPAPLNRMLEEMLAAEQHVVGRVRLPVGVSLMGLAVKRSAP